MKSSSNSINIAYIGGGSREWARKLMFDLALCPELNGNVALYDIDLDSALLNEKFGNWLQSQPDVVSHWQYTAVNTLEKALKNADFVIISIQPGSLELMAKEIAIVEKYGLYFPVGDTSGAPGAIRALRASIIYQGFAEKIAKICPDAWVINYTNPMAVCTRTLTRVAPELKVIGCCHEVFAVQKMLAQLAAQNWNISLPARNEIEVTVTGINHFTWLTSANWNGRDLFDLLRYHITQPDVIRPYTQQEVESWNDWFRSAHQIKFKLFERFGIFPAAGDRHLVEFLPGFIQSPDILFQNGIIRTPVSFRIARWKAAPQKTLDLMTGRTPLQIQNSGEEGVSLIKAFLGLGDQTINLNFKNLGQVAELPLDAVVETNAVISKDKVSPLKTQPFPPSLLPLITRHSVNQETLLEAALTSNKNLAFQAIYLDPTNSLTIDQTWSMFNELVAENRQFMNLK